MVVVLDGLHTFVAPVTGVTSAKLEDLGASSGQVGSTTNCILVDGQDVTPKLKAIGLLVVMFGLMLLLR